MLLAAFPTFPGMASNWEIHIGQPVNMIFSRNYDVNQEREHPIHRPLKIHELSFHAFEAKPQPLL